MEAKARATDIPPAETRRAAFAHAVPYLVWIAFILVLFVAPRLGFARAASWAAPAYAAKSAICAALLLWLRPWRYYASAPRCGARGIGLGLAVGLLVAVLWILPESPWLFRRAPWAVECYNRWFILPPGGFPDYFRPDLYPDLPPGHPSLAYAPESAGWGMAVAKLLGSAFVISAAEEYFFRGFLYRWLRNARFLSLPVGAYDATAFWTVVAVFGLEHDRWLLGMVAGLVYGWLVLRTGRILPAVVAHALTNLLLGLHVLLSHQYGFW